MKACRQSFPTKPGELRRLSAWVRSCAATSGIKEEVAYRMELCVNEAAANIIFHGAASELMVEFEDVGDRARLTISDEAAPFDPLQHPPMRAFTSIEDAPTRGFGIHLLRSFASAIEYRREANRNVLTLWFEEDARPV
jgi:anti-sigma regulatory factor (Ser/Thr protein kinase)